MKFLHTADWHIGQSFHEYDRTYEHQQFLNWLVTTLQEEQIDVLLISGDVFDLSNPSAASVKMFYGFLSRAIKMNPALQIIITAGNHDSASRLEAPKPLLESSNVHIVGLVERDTDGYIDYEKLVIPVRDRSGATKVWCMAVPFLRMGDYPAVSDCDNPYSEGVAALYRELYAYVLHNKKQTGQVVIAMGHLHAQSADVDNMDKTERQIMGGVECISASVFDPKIKYVALGHIHKAQRLGGKDYIRYSGSPIPMSFSEIKYSHQVFVFEIESENFLNGRAIEVPVTIPLKSQPSLHSPLADVLIALQQLPEKHADPELAPYLEVRVLQNGPEPALKHSIDNALKGKHVRLARINVKDTPRQDSEQDLTQQNKLQELDPVEVFSRVYQSKYNTPVPEELMQLFMKTSSQVSEEV